MGNLLLPERIRVPVEVALEEVRDAELGADKVVHEKFDALGRKGVIVRTRAKRVQRVRERQADSHSSAVCTRSCSKRRPPRSRR